MLDCNHSFRFPDEDVLYPCREKGKHTKHRHVTKDGKASGSITWRTGSDFDVVNENVVVKV